MERARFADEQIVRILQEAVRRWQGSPSATAVSEPSLYAWRKRFGDMDTDDVRKLKALEQENTRLKKPIEMAQSRPIVRAWAWSRELDPSKRVHAIVRLVLLVMITFLRYGLGPSLARKAFGHAATDWSKARVAGRSPRSLGPRPP